MFYMDTRMHAQTHADIHPDDGDDEDDDDDDGGGGLPYLYTARLPGGPLFLLRIPAGGAPTEANRHLYTARLPGGAALCGAASCRWRRGTLSAGPPPTRRESAKGKAEAKRNEPKREGDAKIRARNDCTSGQGWNK